MTPERLQQLVRDGGLHYEMKLLRAVADTNANLREIAQGDLKGLLLGALDELHTMAASAEPRLRWSPDNSIVSRDNRPPISSPK